MAAAAAAAAAASSKKAVSSLFSLIPANLRPQTTDLSAGVLWGATLGIGALWLVQPFDWIKQQFTKSEEASSS